MFGRQKGIGIRKAYSLLGHHHAFPPVEGGLWAREALQRTPEMAAEDLDLLEAWVRIKCPDIDFTKGSNFIVGDGCIHFLNIIRTVESLE